jgi:hypothetical protein
MKLLIKMIKIISEIKQSIFNIGKLLDRNNFIY